MELFMKGRVVWKPSLRCNMIFIYLFINKGYTPIYRNYYILDTNYVVLLHWEGKKTMEIVSYMMRLAQTRGGTQK